jgi:hypothetical protein
VQLRQQPTAPTAVTTKIGFFWEGSPETWQNTFNQKADKFPPDYTASHPEKKVIIILKEVAFGKLKRTEIMAVIEETKNK